MKKIIFFAIPLLILLAFFQDSYARSSYKTYKLTEIRSDGIVIMDPGGGKYIIEKEPGDIKVGDLVRYDSVRHRLRKSPWQLAEIINMTNRKLTLKVSSGETVDINMRNEHRGKFNQGDQVLYNGSSGQIKNSNFQELDDE